MIIFSFILYIKRDNAYKDIEFVFFFKNLQLLIDDDSEDKKAKDTKNMPKKT